MPNELTPEEIRERRKQRILNNGKDRLARIQSSLYKSIDTDDNNTHVAKAEEVAADENPKIAVKESSQLESNIQPSQSVPVTSSTTQASESKKDEIREFLRKQTASIADESEPLLGSSTPAVSSTTSSLGRENFLLSICLGIVAFVYTLYAALQSAGAVETELWTRQNIKLAVSSLSECMQNNCSSFEWQQNGAAGLIPLYVVGQTSWLAYRTFLRGQNMAGTWETLFEILRGFPSFFFSLCLCWLVIGNTAPILL